MMVPRTFAGSYGASLTGHFDEKDILRYVPKKQKRDGSRTISPSRSPPLRPRSVPSPPAEQVGSSRTDSYAELQPSKPPTPSPSPNSTDVAKAAKLPPKRRESAHELLAATAIPIRRKPKQRAAQRIPSGDHVSEFSRLLQDDINSQSGSVSSSLGQYDGLFGNIDGLVEGDMFLGSEDVDSRILVSRSASTMSMPSLSSPKDQNSTPTSSVSPSFTRSTSDRRLRLVASSEDSSSQHPLMPESDDDGSATPQFSVSPVQRRRRKPEQRRPGAFKSSLTASLKAIKSAAQSVSNYTASASFQPDEFLSHSIFDIQPALTDDRRPPPSSDPPSPALRRYLNPNHVAEDSPTQLHFWLDSRSSQTPPPPASSQPNPLRKPNNNPSKPNTRSKRKLLKSGTNNNSNNSTSTNSSHLPPIVPLATCLPSTIRTAHASSPPIWLAPDGTPTNKRTAFHFLTEDKNGSSGGLKQREPRENRDFLRVYVAEMLMRKSGKLDDKTEGRARMWLPPVEEGVRRGRELPRGEGRWVELELEMERELEREREC